MNHRPSNAPTCLSTKPQLAKLSSARNNPSFDLSSKPMLLKPLADQLMQVTRQNNHNIPQSFAGLEAISHRLPQSKTKKANKNPKQILKQLITVTKSSSRMMKKSSEKLISEKSPKHPSKAPNKNIQLQISRDKIPANLRQIPSKPFQNMQQVILGQMASKREFTLRPPSNLENRKPKPSNLLNQNFSLALPTHKKRLNSINCEFTEQTKTPQENGNTIQTKIHAFPADKPSALVSDKFALPTSSTICEKSKSNCSTKLHFRQKSKVRNATSNGDVTSLQMDKDQTELQCGELVSAIRLNHNTNPTSLKCVTSTNGNCPIKVESIITARNKTSTNTSDVQTKKLKSEGFIHNSSPRGEEFMKYVVSEMSSLAEDDEISSSFLIDEEEILKSRTFHHETFANQFDSATLHYLISQEAEYAPNPHYIEHRQRNLKWQMRAILLDWMSEVCSDYLFKRETFHIALNYVDRYLSSKADIEKGTLQLVGLTALFLAAKLEEVYTPKVENMIAAANNTYSADQILSLEHKMYFTLGFKVTPPTINLWSNWYMTQWDNFLEESAYAMSHPLLKSQKTQARFRMPSEQSYALFREYMQLVDTAILDIQTLQYKPRAIIAAFFYVLLGKKYEQFSVEKIVSEFPYSSLYLLDESFAYNDLFSNFMENYFGMSLLDLLPTIQYVSTYFSLPTNLSLPVAAKIDKENVLKVS
jgi:hypothetical protein